MRYVLTTHRGSIIEISGEFYVYHGRKLIRVCPSEGMAREVFAGE